MKFLIAVFLTSSAFAHTTFDLAGKWQKTTGTGHEAPVHFIKINGQYHYHGKENYVFQDGRLSHTIDQDVKIHSLNGDMFEGTVSFFDSRGCSYKNLKVTGEFQNESVVNILMTVPRYQVVTVTTRRNTPARPRYCRVPYPGRGYYVCGHIPEVVSRRTECRLLEYVEVPVQLERI